MKKLTTLFILLFILILASCENPLFVEASKLYTVSFETNGGTKIESLRTDKVTEIPQTQKEDSTFIGWYTSSDYSGSPVSFPLEVKQNITLYAKWIDQYLVSFETNGGTKIDSYKTNIIQTSPKTQKEQADFVGWYKFNDFSEKISFPYELSEDTTLYAKWERQIQSYSVSFVTNGGTAVDSFYGTVIHDFPDTTRNGFTFEGWYSDESLMNPVSFPYSPESDCILYAKWKIRTDITYTVKHYKQEQDLCSYKLYESEQLSGTYGMQTSASSKEYQGFHSKSFNQKSIKADGTTEIEIYYDRDSITVIFDANDGSGRTYSQTFYYDVGQKLKTNQFTRANYFFTGWIEEDYHASICHDDGSYMNFCYPQGSVITLYARWVYGTTVTDSTISTLDLSNLSEDFLLKVTGSINQNTLINLAGKIAAANKNITLDLSETKDIESIASTSDKKSVFANCPKLKSIILPSCLKIVGGYAFYNCTLLSSVTIPSKVTTIGEYAFYGCSSLSSIGFPTGIQTIGTYAFSKTGITKLSISNITTIGSYAFYACNSLQEVTVNKVGKIESSAFSHCSSLYQVSIVGNGILEQATIGGSAFSGCKNLTKVSLSGFNGIYSYAFYECSSLSNVSMTNIRGLYQYTFAKCTSLTSITIDAESISSYAFSDCSILTSVTFGSKVSSISANVFNNCTNLISVTFLMTYYWYCGDYSITVTNPTTNANKFKNSPSLSWMRK